jgi:hypothetical protein
MAFLLLIQQKEDSTEGGHHENSRNDVSQQTFFSVQAVKLAVSYLLGHVYQRNAGYWLHLTLSESFADELTEVETSRAS